MSHECEATRQVAAVRQVCALLGEATHVPGAVIVSEEILSLLDQIAKLEKP